MSETKIFKIGDLVKIYSNIFPYENNVGLIVEVLDARKQSIYDLLLYKVLVAGEEIVFSDAQIDHLDLR